MTYEAVLITFVAFLVLALFTRIEAIRLANRIEAGNVKFSHYVHALGIVLGHTCLFVVLVPAAVVSWIRERKRG